VKEKRNFREVILGRWGRWAAEHWGKTLLIGALITLFLTIGVSRLQLEMTFFSIMPGSSEQVQDFKQIMNEFPFASGIIVVIDGRHIEDASQAASQVKSAVDALERELNKEEYSPYVAEVAGRMDREYFQKHGLILSDGEDIYRFADLYGDLNLVPFFTALNDDFEREYSGNEENLAEDEELAVSQFEGLGEFLTLLDKASQGNSISQKELDKVVEDFLFGEGYVMSRDNKMALVMVQPTFTMEDLTMLVPGVNLIEAGSKALASQFGLEAGLTGITTVGRDEMVTSEQGLAGSMTIAMVLIMLLMIFAFRMFSVPLISGIPLLIGIYWTLGVTGFTIHRLNIMTAMYMVALVGLGIDFAIHLLTAFRQERDGGKEFLDAMEGAFVKSGAGIITGAFTTAIAFFALQLAESEIMRELGVVAGFGLVFELFAMLVFIPALLGLREARRVKRGKGERGLFQKVQIKSTIAQGLGARLEKTPGVFIALTTILVLALATQAGKVTIETNLLNMEAEGLESVELQDTLVEEFDMGADGLFIISNDLSEVKALEEALEDLESVKQVDSIAPLLLTQEEYQLRKGPVEDFRNSLSGVTVSQEMDSTAMADQLIRLQMNLLEMSDMAYLGNMEKMLLTLGDVTGFDRDGQKVSPTSLDRLIQKLEEDPEEASPLVAFQERLVPLMEEKLWAMASPEFVDQSMLPALYRNSYISNTTGAYLLSVIPTQNPWEGDFREIFTTQIASVTPRATGMLLATDQLTKIAETDGVRAAYMALVAIFLVLLVDFKNLKLVILTMLPLMFSFVALFGFMGLTGIKFDFVNIIAVPLLIGMGVDDAVHISHRYLIEGKGSIRKTVGYTGTAVLLTTISTVIAFASFIPSVMRAMSSTGVVLSVAMTFAFLFSIVLYPALLRVIIDKTSLNIGPWRGFRRNK